MTWLRLISKAMEQFIEILFSLLKFGGQTLIIVFALASLLLLCTLMVARTRYKSNLEVKDLNETWAQAQLVLGHHSLNKKAQKALGKETESLQKTLEDRPRVFILDFKGDIQASEAESLRDEITFILQFAKPSDEVLLRLESPGGMVPHYGLAAAQLVRIRQANLKLTICVDKIAASGGYMMACTGSQILAAPFALIGSIGVVAQLPNFNRVIKKHDVDFYEVTAGEHKRTLTLFGEVTPEKLDKFTEQIEMTHTLFKDFVAQYRPKINIAEVTSGEYWYGTKCIENGLVDALQVSDDYLFQLRQSHHLLEIKYKRKVPLSSKFEKLFSLLSLLERLRSFFPTQNQKS